ncbi:GTP cyclohydrolase II RibA [Streptomyces sp. NPDC021093]|uniref:GTP cyclohydrolase II RibA n=1 Tax=Streptomyces sp. NPDC021093 TaxID=3365112 RepID=UPI0037A9C007
MTDARNGGTTTSSTAQKSQVHDAVTVRSTVEVPVRLADGFTTSAQMTTFRGLSDGEEHLALAFGPTSDTPLVRLHSECLTGDVFGSARCDCGPQLTESLKLLSASGGLLLYLRQEGRGIGLYNKLDAYDVQDRLGLDTFAANRHLNFSDDLRDYRAAAQMLHVLGASRLRLLSNNPDKTAQLREYGIEIVDQVPTGAFLNERNLRYLRAKVELHGHCIEITQEIA